MSLFIFGLLVPSVVFAAGGWDFSPLLVMGGMMEEAHMRTEELDLSCSILRSLDLSKKKEIVVSIAHNMDKDALRPIFRCLFPRQVKRVLTLRDAALKFDPTASEVLYYIPTTQQFFATCHTLNSVAYMVQGEDVKNPKAYLATHRGDFVEAVKMAKEMVEGMMMP